MPSKRIWAILGYSHSKRLWQLALPKIKSKFKPRKERADFSSNSSVRRAQEMRNIALWEMSISQEDEKRYV